MAERPLYTLYKNLKAQNYDVPDDYNKFESALTRDGKGGADNRHAIYENLKAQNFDVPSTYERFYSALFEPRSRTSSRAKGGSVPMSAADRARFSAGAAAISASAQQTMNNAGRYNRLRQRKQKQQKDFGRVNLGTHQTPYGGDANNVVKDDFAYNPETGKTGAYVTSDNENVYSLPEAEQMQAILDKQNDAYQVAVNTGEIPSAFDVRDKNGNYDLQENIGKNGTYLTEEGAQKQFDKKLADAYARKKEIETAIAEDHRLHGNPLLSYGASIGASNGRTAEQSDYSNKLATSLALVKQQIGALEAVKQYPTSSWGEDALKALDNTAFTAKTWDFGLTDFATMGQMERIKTKMDNNIPLSGSDKMLLKSKLGADAAAALEDEKMGNIYRWTKIAGQSLPFMADFFLTGGYGGITKGISRGALKFAAKRGMGKVSAAILKNTGIVAGDVIGSYAMAGTEQALKTGADIMQRHLGNLYQDEKGDYKFGTFDENGNLLHEGGESMGTALYKGMTSAMVENYTEKLFGHNYGIKKGAVNFMEKHGMNAFAEFFKNIGKSGWYTNSKKWMEKFGINGFAEEVMEEEIGIPLHALLDGEGKVSDLLDAKQQLDIIGGMAISVGSMYAMGAGSRPVKGIYNRAQYYRFRNKVNVADSDAQNLMGDNWADIKDKIDNATNEQMGSVLADILRKRDTMTKEQINAAVNYGVNLMKMRGYNIAKTAEMNAKEITNEPTTPEEQHQADIDNAYSEGHDADDADKHDIQIQQEDQMKTLAAALGISEQQLSAMSDEELESLTGQDDKLDQAIYDYQLSSARYQGVVDDAQDKVDLAAHQAEQRVDMYTDQSRGSVRNATIKASGGLEDYGVYIISGNIATHDDGSIDVSNSDDMILYYDPTTNSVEHADALMFAELGEELPADEVKAQAVSDAKENAIKEVAGIIDGTVEVGSQFNVTDTDGSEHTYEVLADYGDGTAAISIDGNVVENPYSLADLQQMKDLEDQKRLEAAKAEREQMEKERAAQQNQETEETQPSFDFNQILNDNGNVVLVDVLDKDGNTKYPDSRLFLIRDAGAKAKVVELKSDGTLVPHAVNKEDVATISSMSLDEYKQAMPESSMIEDNSGEESDEDSQLANLGLPKGSEIWMSGDGFGRPKENTLSRVVGIDEQGSIILEDKDGKKWSASFDYINNHRELPPLDENTNIVNEENNQSESNAEENTPAPEQTPAMTLEDGTIVPMLEDGNPDFSKLTAAQTAELYDTQFGEDADSIVSGYVSDAKKALDKASNMTVKGKTFVEQKASKDAKEKAIADAQAAYDSAIAIRDAYNERQLAKVEDTAEGRKELIEKARRKFARLKSAVKDDAEAVSQLYRDTIGSLLHRLYDSTGIDVTDTTPLTAEEYVASNLGAHSLNYEGTETSKGVKQETGLSREDFAKTQLLAADGKGTTIDALVHSLWENRPSNLESLDTQDIRNALIGVLNSGFKASEARNFVENIRIAQAENILEEQKRAQENAAYAEQHKAESEAELKAKSDEKAELKAKSEAKLDNESDNKSNDLDNDLDNEKTNDNINDNINTLTPEQQKAKEDGEKLGFPAVDNEGEPINEYVVELANWAKKQGLEIDPTSKSNSYADLFLMCKDGFGVSTLVPDEGENINQVVYFPDNVQDFDQLWKLQEEFNAGRDLKHSSNIDSELTEGATFYDGDTAREFKEFVDKKVEEQNKVFGEQRSEEDLPFSAKDNGKQQTTAERAADVEKNKVDDIKVVDNIVGEKTRKAFERLAKMMGANIQWQYSDKLGNGWIQETTDADGNVHRTIFITLDSSIKEGAQFIFGHEMTHQIKNLNPAAYNELTQLVLDTYGSDAFDKAVDETMQRYSDAGFSGRARDYYAEEVVADSVGEMIRDLNLAHTLAMKMSHPLLAAIHEILQKIKLAFFGTEYSDVTKNIIRSIEQAYVKTANGQVTNSETGEDVSFSLRQKPEPKKKGVGYKVFVLKDGKLYPPMVANPDGAATPVGVWLDADAAPIAGESKTGRPQVKQGGKGTQGGSGKLAYRPGWHLGVVPYAIQFNRKDAEGNKTLFPKNFVFAEVVKEGAQFIFGHEMTHQIKNLNPAAYNELTQLVLDTYGSDAFDKAVDETMQRYSDAGFSGRARDYYAEEVVADSVGEMIRDLNLAHTLAMKMSHPLLAAIHEILQKIKLAFFGTEYSDVTKNIIRSIEQAYVKTANGQVTNSETGEDVSFSLRQKPEPKKKGVGYKVFVLKDGKLYPPMVANPDGAATPVGVWLDADAAPIAGESKTGRPQVKQGGKGTQGGSGKLAYRPGWHLGVVPYAIQFNRKDAEGNKTLFPKNFVFAEVEYAADVDYQEEARQEGINPSGKYQHSLAGLKHLPTDGYYMYRTNPNPETDPWVITGAMKVNRILTRAEQAELVKNAGREPQQIQEGDIVTDDVVNSINQEIADAPKFSLKVYHGSGADFTEFDFDHMGEGAGSQVFGWGGYVTSSKKIGKSYANIVDANAPHQDVEYVGNNAHAYTDVVAGLFNGGQRDYDDVKEFLLNGYNADKDNARKKQMLEWFESTKPSDWKSVNDGKRNLYEVDIPEDNGNNYLEWEKTLTEKQINAIRDALAKNGIDISSFEKRGFKLDLPFKNVYAAVLPTMMHYKPKDVSKFLSSLGFTGIKYPAGTIMGGAEENDTNYVVFKPEDMKITEHTKFSLRLKSAIEETETNPSDAQKESGNYKKGHIKFGGYDYTIENPKGSTRSGKDADGKEWKVTMHDTYGYIRGKFGKDGDHLDMFINDKADLDNWNGDVFVVDQVNPDGSFDEHKVMYGYDSMDDAKKAYLANYSDGWQGLGNITGVSKDEFDKWLDTSNRKLKPFADYAKVKFSLKDIKPVGVGAFGNIYNQFRGKAKAAIEFLKKLGSGEATAALHHHTIGDISLVWGDKKTGLDKILRKHPEVVDNLQSIIDSMEVVQESDNRIKLESPTHFAVVSKEYKGEPREQWLLTAYEKRESLENGKSMDTATSSLGGDTALSQSKESAAKIDNSSETAKENGEKFSLKDEKTMFGMHNISLDKLRKAIKQGGFAAPSMGVIDSKNGIYSGYGEITLIPKAEKIAKRTGKNIGTYAADAWTPIYPPVEKKFGGNGGDVAYDDIESVPKEMQRLTRNAINSFMDGREANGLAYLYLQEKGKAPELVHVEGKYPKELHDEVKGILGKLNGIYNTTDEQKEKLLDLFIREVYDGNKEEFDNDIKKFIKKDEELIKKRPNSNIAKNKQLDVDWMKEHGYDYGALSRFVDGILRDAETSGKVDENATMKAAQQYIQDKGMKEDFDSWKEKLNDRYNVEEVIFAGYKPDGNRKYLPNTVENAVKVMKQDGKNASVGSASFSHFVASILKPMGTLDQIRKKKGNLTGNYEDVEKFQEKWQPVYDELADKMQPDAEPFESYGMDRLEEVATQKNPKKYAKEEYGVDLTDEDINKLNELIEAVKNDKPSIYFETKFMRPYGLDEFEKAIVPNDTPSDVVDALKMAGIDVSSYERGNAEDRQKVTMDAINSSDNIRFSLKSMMAKPEGWKQANKKAIHIAEAIERDPKFSLKNLDGTLIKAGTYFSGGGLVEEGLKGIIDPVVAVEYDEKISGVYRNNFGQHIVTADVRDVDPKELVKQIDGEVEYFHASPVCKNYSQAKSNHAEVELDKETAASTAEFINAIKPKVVTIENVKGYKDSEAMKTITDALDANGYTWDADVYNAANYGGYTNRERLIVRAVRDGKLPEKPKKMEHKSGWYEAVADIIPTLTEKKNGVAPWMDVRLKADGIDWRNIDKPLYVMGSAYADGKVPHAFADELLPTLRTKSGDVIVMPDGKVYRAMGRVLARVSGVSDDYKMPFSENLSHTIIGNGIPTQLTEHVIAPLLQNTLRPTTPDDGNTKFSLRYDQFEHDLNQWKKDNNLPKDAQRPTIPQRNAGESAVDFLRRVDEYRKQMALWKTAPTYEQHLLSDDTALGEFNRELQRGSVLKRIAFQDSMLAIRKAQEAIMKEVGVDRLNMAEDAYTAENRSHGKGKNEFEEYNNEFLQPLRKAYHQMKKVLGDSYDNVRIYMMAKHGLERDSQMAFKKSLEADYEDVAQRSAAYKAYKGDMNRIINDSDLEFGRVDFTTWRQRDNALRAKYSPSYMDYRYDKNGIAYDYSGLSALFDGSDFEEAANKLVKDIEDKYVTETHNLWDATNAATKKILRDGYKAGMMSKDTYQYVRDMYSHYIPLRGWDGTTADQVWDYIGGGKGAFNQTLKTAHGRTSIADDPIAYIENMAESGILLNNKNWVKQHLMLLAQNHPTSLLTLSKAWYVKSTDANGNEEWIPATPQITSQMNSNQVKAAIDAFEKKMEQMAQTGDATQKRDGLNIAYPQTHSEEREHEVRVMKDGEEYVIYVNGDPQLAQAMNNTRAHRVREIQSGKLDRAAAWLGRKMAAAYTSLSPLFIPSNYFRDLTMTLASTAIREDARYNYLLGKNLATSWNLGFMLKDYQNGKLREKVSNGNATPKEQMFYDFMMNGGETGFVSSLDVENLKKKFKNDLKDLDRWKANPVKVGHTIMDSIEFLNRMIEDSNRFAVYMTSIKYGRSIDEAVNDAKDVTLNFNRKGTGEYGWQMIRNLYLFINPAVQSLQTLGALAKHHPFKFTAVTVSWLVSGVLVPVVNAALMNLLGGDDDKDKYWQFTKWDRRNNLIMWVPFTHEYIKIPLAQEFRAFYGIGDMIASKIMGGELAEESWSQYAEDLLGQVVDMLPLDPTGYDGNIAVSLMPNAIRPVFELAFNVDFTGKPLFKETEYNKYDPNFTKAYVGTPDWLVRASKMVNSIGNDYPDVQQNSIDAFGDPRYNLNNPAVVDHVLSSYLGGAYTMGSQVLGVLTKSLNDPKEIKMADIPLFSKFVSNPDDRPVTKKQGDEFWDMKENHDRAANTLSKLKKQAKVDGDYSLLERFYGSEEYKQYKQDDVKVKKYEEDKKKERAEESGEEYRPHKLNAEDIYKAHATPKDDFEDLKLKQLYTKLNGFKSAYDLLVDTAPSQSDGYYNTNKAAIDAIDEISLDKQEISELKKGFLDDGKDAYNAEDMKQIRELRKKILAVLEKANKVVVANQKAKAEK
jgi:site-specific DNA-cytosine methylase